MEDQEFFLVSWLNSIRYGDNASFIIKEKQTDDVFSYALYRTIDIFFSKNNSVLESFHCSQSREFMLTQSFRSYVRDSWKIVTCRLNWKETKWWNLV